MFCPDSRHLCLQKSGGVLSPALVCSRWLAMVLASSLGAPGICVQSKYYTFPAFEAILFRKLRLFCSGICDRFVPEVETILFRHLWKN